LAGLSLSQQPDYDEIPEVAQIDELPTFVGNKKNKIWLSTAVNKGFAGILALTIGDRSAETFKPLWKIIKGWKCFFYATDGYIVYPQFIDETDHIVSKTYMTRVEGENTRLRHYLSHIEKVFVTLSLS
jgi:IS1 family transposase